MIQPSEEKDGYDTLRATYRVKKLENRKDAKSIINFFFAENSFDDRNFTPGEIIQMKSLPYKSLRDSGFQFWYEENQDNEIVGVISLRENEQKSGGYLIDYVAVHNQYRNQGIALQLMDIVINFVQSVNGRYIQVNTCDTVLYEGGRKLFEKKGFYQAGHLSDYYFEGEGMIIYCKIM